MEQARLDFEKTLGRVVPRMAGALVGEYASTSTTSRSTIRLSGARPSLGTTGATDTCVNGLLALIETADPPAFRCTQAIGSGDPQTQWPRARFEATQTVASLGRACLSARSD